METPGNIESNRRIDYSVARRFGAAAVLCAATATVAETINRSSDVGDGFAGLATGLALVGTMDVIAQRRLR